MGDNGTPGEARNLPRASAFTAKVHIEETAMRIRTLSLAAVAALTLGAAACSEADQDAAEANTEEAAADAGAATEKAGDALAEEASQLGDAIEAGAKEAAQEVDEATDRLQKEAAEQEAETATDAQGN